MVDGREHPSSRVHRARVRSCLSYNVHVYDYWVANAVIAVASSTVGAVITSRRPANLIGWLFCVIGLLTEHASSAPSMPLTHY